MGLLLACLPAAAQTPAINPKTGAVHSQRLHAGMPLGGLGTGTFQLNTDGSVSRAAVFDARPTGDLRGCFAAVWTRTAAGGGARVLSLNNAYGLPSVRAVNFEGAFPIADLTFPDSDLPIFVALRAFTPLIPFDVKNSSRPGAAFIFRLKNSSPVAMEASVALGWQAMGGRLARAAVLPSAGGYFGVGFSEANLAQPLSLEANERKAGGDEMVLLAYPARRGASVTAASWDALSTRPLWWDGFAKEGTVSGDAPITIDAHTQGAGVVAVRFTLKPREVVEIPFVVAWYTPGSLTASGDDGGRWYKKAFTDAADVGRSLLDDWRGLLALTDEWQSRLRAANLPPWLIRNLINSTAPLATHTVHVADRRFDLLARTESSSADAPPDGGKFAGLRERLAAQSLLLAFFPQLDAQELARYAGAQRPDGLFPSALGSLSGSLGPPVPASLDAPPVPTPAPIVLLPAPSNAPISEADANNAACWLIGAARYVQGTGDRDWLDRYAPNVRRALAALLKSGQADRKTPVYTPPMLAAFHAALPLLTAPEDADLAALCREAGAKAQAVVPANDGAFSLPSDVGTLDDALSQIETGQPEAGLARLLQLDTERNNIFQTPWQSPDAPNSDRYSLARAADWNALNALSGFSYDGLERRLILTPHLPGTSRSLIAPIFAPTFWARLEYRPMAKGGLLTLRLDRLIPLARAGRKPNAAPVGSLTLDSLRVPGPFQPDAAVPPVVNVSVGQNPIGVKVTVENTNTLLLTFETPLTLQVGDRLEVDVH